MSSVTPAKDVSPAKAVRMKCLDCCGGSSNEVKLCTVERCALWPYRFGKQPDFTSYQGRDLDDKIKTMKVHATAARAIKAHCKECNGPDIASCEPGDGYEWCPLFQYVQAKKKKKKNLSPEARQKLSDRMKALHAERKKISDSL